MSWDLIAWSFAVVRKNKQLLLFPILSALAALSCILLFGLARYTSIQKIVEGSPTGIFDYLWLLPAYFVVSFAMVFFNCALAACAQALFAGGEPTLGYGLQQAGSRLGPIMAWALLSASVGLLLNAIERYASWAGKLAIWIFGFAWAMATYLVVPVLIAEDRGGFGSLQRSAQLVRETWGQQLVAEIRFGWRAALLFLPCLVLGAIGANGYPVFLPVAVIAFVAVLAGLNAAKGIFEVALYRHVVLHETPAGWSPQIISGIAPRQ